MCHFFNKQIWFTTKKKIGVVNLNTFTVKISNKLESQNSFSWRQIKQSVYILFSIETDTGII